MPSAKQRREWGSKGGKTTLGQLTPEQHHEMCSKGGKTVWARLTAEQRSEKGRMMVRTRWAKRIMATIVKQGLNREPGIAKVRSNAHILKYLCSKNLLAKRENNRGEQGLISGLIRALTGPLTRPVPACYCGTALLYLTV